MNDEIKSIFKDRNESFFPNDENAFDKLKCKELKPGQKIQWYYQGDKDFADEADFDIKQDPGFSGIVMPMPDTDLNGHDDTDLEADDCIIVVTQYPAEKEYCRCGWVYLNRLLDQKGLIEVF